MNDKIKVLIIEDDADIRESLSILIKGMNDFELTGSYDGCEPALAENQVQQSDVLLLDIDLTGMTGIEGIPLFRQKNPELDIIMMTVHENPELVFEALKAGACGYLTKNVQPVKILESIREIYNGGAPMSSHIARMVVDSMQTKSDTDLSDREKEVLTHLCHGESYKIIAENLFISEETVRFHIKNIYKKLQVHSKSEAVSKALREKIV